MMNEPQLTIGQCAALACLLEAKAPKPGNVHRGADFDDLTFTDLVAAGIAIGPAMDAAVGRSMGEAVGDAVAATKLLVGTNANLGIILLLAPMAQVPRNEPLASKIAEVLTQLTPRDAEAVYLAIRQANPGGLGQVDEHDIAEPPPRKLLDAMRLAADRDLVARQYANNFHEVLNIVLPRLQAGLQSAWSLDDTIVNVHLQMMSDFPDSLIARKCGQAVAKQAADHAAEVLAAGAPGDETYHRAIAELDFWLRSDGHRRNPGTTADLIAAGLFAALRDGIIGNVS